jgi:hypothetical protein
VSLYGVHNLHLPLVVSGHSPFHLSNINVYECPRFCWFTIDESRIERSKMVAGDTPEMLSAMMVAVSSFLVISPECSYVRCLPSSIPLSFGTFSLPWTVL